MFFDDAPPGIALIRLFNGTRNWIDINTGANNKLVTYVQKRKREFGESAFSDFLARSKWVHISSLADFEQFAYIIDEIEKAKQKNPWLKVSLDPGYEYTKKYRLQLKKAFMLADYVFLNENEVDNLTGNSMLSRKDKFNVLAMLFNEKASSNNKNIVIIKGKKHQQVVNFIDGTPYTRTFWHRVLKPYQIRNDTGAGDAFAGGLIAGILSNDLLTQQAASIRLGAIAATSRMQSKMIHSLQ